MILFVPGRAPWDAIVYPISPEWGLMRAVVLESADAIFNFSQTGAIGNADRGRGKVGRDHMLHALHRVFDLPFPPMLAAGLSSQGIDLRAGLNIEDGEDPSNPGSSLSFLRSIPIGTGERITGRMGRTKDVNGFHDKKTAAWIKDIFGAGGSAYVAFVDGMNAGMNNVGGTFGQGLSEGTSSFLDTVRRQARYTNPLGKVFKTNANDEIATSLRTKRDALNSLSKDAKVLKGGEGFITIEGEQVPIDTIVPTTDPVRIDLAMQADVVKGNVAMLDKTISTLRADISKATLATTLGSARERRDIVDGLNSQIQHFKSMQLAAMHDFEEMWSKQLTDKYERKIVVDLSGGMGTTAAARN